VETALLDAAFRLVSHSVSVQEARSPALTTDDARLAELRKEFPEVDSQVLKHAFAWAQRLEQVALEMADLARGQRNDNSGPPLNGQTLAERCPGFSSESYSWAVNDGYHLTRK
jgi:hypothetical protein